MHKLKAFTLMELLVGMIISSIVIAFAYSAYSLIYKQYVSYRSVKSKVIETMQLHTVMSNDFNNSEYSTFDSNKLKLNTTNNTLTYNFIDSLIIRIDNELSDTFKLVARTIQVKPVFNDVISNDTLINNIQFDVFVFDNTEHFTFTKKYTAQTLMNYEMQNKLEE